MWQIHSKPLDETDKILISLNSWIFKLGGGGVWVKENVELNFFNNINRIIVKIMYVLYLRGFYAVLWLHVLGYVCRQRKTFNKSYTVKVGSLNMLILYS